MEASRGAVLLGLLIWPDGLALLNPEVALTGRKDSYSCGLWSILGGHKSVPGYVDRGTLL